MNVLLQSLYLAGEKLTSYVYIREHRLCTYTYLLRMAPEMFDVSDGALPSEKRNIVIAVRDYFDTPRIINIVSDFLILLPVSYPLSAVQKQRHAHRFRY